jgi:heme exporter protein D
MDHVMDHALDHVVDLVVDLGPHAAFIVISYVVVCAIVVLLVGWIVGDYRRQLRTLQRLEAEGVTRRSVRQDERR